MWKLNFHCGSSTTVFVYPRLAVEVERPLLKFNDRFVYRRLAVEVELPLWTFNDRVCLRNIINQFRMVITCHLRTMGRRVRCGCKSHRCGNIERNPKTVKRHAEEDLQIMIDKKPDNYTMNEDWKTFSPYFLYLYETHWSSMSYTTGHQYPYWSTFI